VPSRCGALSGLSACLDHDVKVRGGYRLLRVNVMPGDPTFRQPPCWRMSYSRMIALATCAGWCRRPAREPQSERDLDRPSW